MSNEAKQPPVKKFRMGSVTAAVWARTNNHGTFYNVTFERGYQDGLDADNNPVYKSTDSFGYSDLSAVKLVAGLAENFVAKQLAENQS